MSLSRSGIGRTVTNAPRGRFMQPVGKTQICSVRLLGECRTLSGTKACPHRCQEPLHANDVHDPREIVGEHVQCHLGRNLRQAVHQKVRRAHPHLERAEGMLNRLAPARMAWGS